jgi:hypothetical protein
MSRSYRIRVRESLRRVIRASDHVSSQLELLEILPPEQMAELLAQELTGRGFERKGKQVVRNDQGISIAVDLDSGEVTVSAAAQGKVDLTSEKEGRAYDDAGPNSAQVKVQLRKAIQASLAQEADRQTAELQKQATDRLEAALGDVRRELDQAVNRATAAALKLKASQMGQIKNLTEDAATGSLTIVVEV